MKTTTKQKYLASPAGRQDIPSTSRPTTPAVNKPRQITSTHEATIPSPTVSSISTTSSASAGSQDGVRCQPDPLDADSIICLGNVTGDNRLGISHFFGRNKRETATIPSEMFPLLCRTHYQEKQYRWKDDPAAIAVFQCDCILATIQKMSIEIWWDADGNWWPLWCGFELQQLKQPPTPTKKSAATHAPLPEWLASITDRHAMGQDDFTCIGKENGVRYSFAELVKIVFAIKSWCKENNTGLPRVEALPITIGMLEEQELELCKSKTRAQSREHTLAVNEHEKARRTPRIGTQARNRAAKLVSQTRHSLAVLERSEREAKARADSSSCTLPAKRLIKKAASASLDEPGHDDEVSTAPSSAKSIPGRVVTLKTRCKRYMSNASDSPAKHFKPGGHDDKKFGKGDLSNRTREKNGKGESSKPTTA